MKIPPVKIHDTALKAGLYAKVEAQLRSWAEYVNAPKADGASVLLTPPHLHRIGWAKGWHEDIEVTVDVADGRVDADQIVKSAHAALDALYLRWPPEKCEGESEERTGNVMVSHDLLRRAHLAMKGTRADAVAEELGTVLAGKGKR